MGRLHGADAYIDSLVALARLSRDVRPEILYIAAAAGHGRVFVVRAVGTNTEGGEFEYICSAVEVSRQGKVAVLEYYEPEDLDAALARFEELRPDPPLRVPPNTATQSRDR